MNGSGDVVDIVFTITGISQHIGSSRYGGYNIVNPTVRVDDADVGHTRDDTVVTRVTLKHVLEQEARILMFVAA